MSPATTSPPDACPARFPPGRRQSKSFFVCINAGQSRRKCKKAEEQSGHVLRRPATLAARVEDAKRQHRPMARRPVVPPRQSQAKGVERQERGFEWRAAPPEGG